MNPLEELAARGLRAYLKDGSPRVGPRELVTEWALRFVEEHRAEIVALLGEDQETRRRALEAHVKESLSGVDLPTFPPCPLLRELDHAVQGLDEEAVVRLTREVVEKYRPVPSRVTVPHRPEEADTQLDEVHATLERQGSEGWTTDQYLAARIPRTPARVGEMRKLGFLIDSPTWEQNKVRYVMRGTMPGSHAARWEAESRPYPVSRLWALHKHEFEKRVAA